MPASLAARHTIRARNERSLRAIVRSNWSGTTAVLVNVTLAPAGDIFRTWQSMVEARLLNAMTPPRSVRERTVFLFSTMHQLQLILPRRLPIGRQPAMVAGAKHALVKCNGYRRSVLATRDRNHARSAVLRPNGDRLLDALARTRFRDRNRGGHALCAGGVRRSHIQPAIAVVPLAIVTMHRMSVMMVAVAAKMGKRARLFRHRARPRQFPAAQKAAEPGPTSR